jgi:hypothetical protein
LARGAEPFGGLASWATFTATRRRFASPGIFFTATCDATLRAARGRSRS